MSSQRDYQELYDRLLEEVGALHRANQRRIRSGMWALLAVTVGLMLLMFLANGNRVFTLMLWILSMFAVAAYLIAVEYMDYELQKKLREMISAEEGAFASLIHVPELPAAPKLPHADRLLRRRTGGVHALPEGTAGMKEAVVPQPVAPEKPAPTPEMKPAVEKEPAAVQPAQEQEPAPRYVALPRGWERILEDPDKLADDLALLTRALQNLSDDLRRPGDEKEGKQ